MTLQAVAGFLGQAGLQHPANLYRNLVASLSGRRTGAFTYDDFALIPSGSSMNLTIGPGEGVLLGTEAVTTQGSYYVWNNANEVISWPASTTLPRVDSLILRVIDTDYGTDAAGSKATWEVVSGTPAASPSAVADSAFAPAGAFYHPGAWWRVADFTVPASSTNLAAATMNHKRKYARVGRRTQALGSDFPSDAHLGDMVSRIDGDPGSEYAFNGSAWIKTNAGNGALWWVGGGGTTSNTLTVGTTETTCFSSSSFSAEANQLYMVEIAGQCSVSVANNTPNFVLRKNNVSGQQIDSFRVPLLGSATGHGFHYVCYFRIGVSDLSMALNLSVQSGSGYTTNVLAANSPVTVNAYRVNPSAIVGSSWAPIVT
jgi:hypothetical protein